MGKGTCSRALNTATSVHRSEDLEDGSAASAAINVPLRRLPLALIVICMLAAAPASGQAAGSSYPFAFGTYKGKFSTGGAVEIRLRRATCFTRLQFTVPAKGACMRIFIFGAPSAACPDGSTVAPVLYAYVGEGEEIHLAKSGRYHAVSTEGIGAGVIIAQTTLALKAKGRKITGTVKVEGSGPTDGPVQCASVTASFTAAI